MADPPKAKLGSTPSGKKPITLLRALGYSTTVVCVIVGCMALSDYGQRQRNSLNYVAREQQRATSQEQTSRRRMKDAVSACVKDDVEAFVVSQDFVRLRLKAPATAKFPTITAPGVRTVYLGDCAHRVSAYVDAQNSFGALLRTRYVVTVKKDIATERWTLKDLNLAQ